MNTIDVCDYCAREVPLSVGKVRPEWSGWLMSIDRDAPPVWSDDLCDWCGGVMSDDYKAAGLRWSAQVSDPSARYWDGTWEEAAE